MTNLPRIFVVALAAMSVGCSSASSTNTAASGATSGASDATGSASSSGSISSSTSGGASGSSGSGSSSGSSTSGSPLGRSDWPTVPDVGGQLLTTSTLVSIVAANDSWAAALQTFSGALAAGTWLPTAGREYGIGAIASLLSVTGPAITANMDATTVIDYLQTLITGGQVPAANGSTIYLLYLPDGISLTDDVTACAYHDAFPNHATSLGDNYAAVSRCAGKGTPLLEFQTTAASHEIFEAASDPLGSGYTLGNQPPDPWAWPIWDAIATQGNIELADLCEGTRITLPGPDGGAVYQRIWSNAAADAGGDPCLPPLPLPYFNVSVAQQWYAIDGGSSLAIPVTGWATATTQDWLLYASIDSSSPGFAAVAKQNFTVTSSLGLESPTACNQAPGMNDGIQATVTVPLPAGLAAGDFAVVGLYSYHLDENCDYLPGEDYDHINYFGVYVPASPGCGMANFSFRCPDNQGFCPANSTCGDHGCDCPAGYTSVDCSNTPCETIDGGCSYPNWWCAPLQSGSCGPENFDLTCGSGANSFDCPSNGVCNGQDCDCAAGYQAQSCDGTVCSGDCNYPNWWCAPAD